MKFQKIILIICYLVLILGCIRFVQRLLDDKYTNLWVIFIGEIWLIWAVLAFKYNKDMPGVGPYSYENGTNQFARTVLLIVILASSVVSICT